MEKYKKVILEFLKYLLSTMFVLTIYLFEEEVLGYKLYEKFIGNQNLKFYLFLMSISLFLLLAQVYILIIYIEKRRAKIIEYSEFREYLRKILIYKHNKEKIDTIDTDGEKYEEIKKTLETRHIEMEKEKSILLVITNLVIANVLIYISVSMSTLKIINLDINKNIIFLILLIAFSVYLIVIIDLIKMVYKYFILTIEDVKDRTNIILAISAAIISLVALFK